ncbi:hypothetical protein MBANPS3_012546 [Mucor bainieri]
MELLLQEACSITQNSTADDTDINFVKLVLSNSVNLMGHSHREKYTALLPTRAFLDHVVYSCCTNRKQKFITSVIPIDTDIDTIFDAMKPVQFDVTNFAILNKARDSEAMYCSIVRSLLEVLFKGTGLEVIDGEHVPSSTQRMSIINQSDTEFGRRVDLMVYESCGPDEIEYSSIEFKTAHANTKLLDYQQVKNIRINTAILNDLIALNKNSD